MTTINDLMQPETLLALKPLGKRLGAVLVAAEALCQGLTKE